MQDTKKRSALKSIIWRIFGVVILAAVTYGYTGNWITTGLVTVIHHVTFLFVFYVHERVWSRINIKGARAKRFFLKMFTYETLCGNIVLGTITYLITGSAKEMTQVTLTYIGIKHITYILNEYVWNKK